MSLIGVLIIGLGVYGLLYKKKTLHVRKSLKRSLGPLLRHPFVVLFVVDVVLFSNFQISKGFTQIFGFLTWLVYTAVLVAIFLVVWRRNRRREKRVESERAWKVETEQAEQERKIREEMRSAGIDEIDVMSGWEFERRMEVHFETMGWTVLRTPGSGDFGADLILTTPDKRKVVIQCKRYTGRKVGKDAVEEVLNAKLYYNADLAMVITNSYLLPSAMDLAKDTQVDVWERKELIHELLTAKAEEEYREQQDERSDRTQEYDESHYESEANSESIPECFRVLFFDNTNVTEEEVMRRYRKLSIVTHPDSGGSNDAFIRLQTAKDECIDYINVKQRS